MPRQGRLIKAGLARYGMFAGAAPLFQLSVVSLEFGA